MPAIAPGALLALAGTASAASEFSMRAPDSGTEYVFRRNRPGTPMAAFHVGSGAIDDPATCDQITHSAA